MIIAVGLFILGVITLIIGAKLLVFGSSHLAKAFRISSLMIGLTLVAFGTSAPELGVGISAALKNEGPLVIGNIIGSNILNILLVLGLCATITPMLVQKKIIQWDVPILIGVTILFWIFTANGSLARWQGILLLAGIFAYLAFAIWWIKKEPTEKSTPPPQSIRSLIIWIILGVILLGFGAECVTSSAIKIATLLHVSELFIGLTLVALGTSLPELVTTLVALQKGHRDLAVGNLIGSNLFNLLAVGGLAGLIAPSAIQIPSAALKFDIPVMLAVSIALLPIIITGHRISRWEGIVFLGYYLLYLAYLFIYALVPIYLPLFTTAFFFFLLPLSLLTLGIALYRHFRRV